MHILSSLSVIATMLLLSSSIAYGESSSMSSKRRTFKMDLEKRPVSSSIQGSSGALGAEGSAEVDLQSIFVDVEYVGVISVGSPPIQFNMVLDTGSSDIWFPSVPCNSCGDHPLFNSKNSSTYLSLDKEWSLAYFDGSFVKGVVGTDTVRIGDLTRVNQTIGLATMESKSFGENKYLDGVFGLAFPSMSLTRQESSIIMDMYKDGQIEEPIVGMHLGRTRDGGKGETIFGGVNQDRFTGKLNYIEVTKQKYWQVDFGGVDIDGTLYTDDSIDQAMIDTGTTLLVVPTSLADAIHASIPHGKFVDPIGWFFPCKTNLNTTVTIKLGGQDFPIPLSELIRERYLAEDPTYCISGVGASDSGLAIMGETFLRNYYSSYNFETARVGFAPSSL